MKCCNRCGVGIKTIFKEGSWQTKCECFDASHKGNCPSKDLAEAMHAELAKLALTPEEDLGEVN